MSELLPEIPYKVEFSLPGDIIETNQPGCLLGIPLTLEGAQTHAKSMADIVLREQQAAKDADIPRY